MHSSLIANILFVLSILGFAAASADAAPAAHLEVRQTTLQTTCDDYAWTANMSTIGANGTYRTVLLQKSNVGTIYNARMMDAAIKKLPPMTADEELNQRCTNFTERALVEAEKNYTMNIVAQYSTEGLPVGIVAGPLVIFIVGACSIIFSVVWVFSG